MAISGKRAAMPRATLPTSSQNMTGEPTRQSMHAALFDTGCPVMLVPPGHPGSVGSVAAIAWKNDDRASKAARAAIPILRPCGSAHVLCAAGLPLLIRHYTEHLKD
jgi:hypothetical protein